MRRFKFWPQLALVGALAVANGGCVLIPELKERAVELAIGGTTIAGPFAVSGNSTTLNEDYTDIDLSLSGGLSIKGASWGRPNDTVGIAGAFNNISGPHANWLAHGGIGVTVGDGALTYASEIVGEAYYSLQLAKGVFVTADYQFLANPGYNAVRGPAHVFAGRILARF